MIPCSECIENLKPDDPRIRDGRYLRCGCDYCDKPQYYRDIEETKEPEKIVVEHIRSYVAPPKVGKLKEDLEELKHNFNEHTKHLSTSKRKKPYIYK